MNNTLKLIGLFLIAFVIGGICGAVFFGNKKIETKTVISVQHDTTYTQIHDTCFIEKSHRLVRNDTVLLARIDTIHTIDSVMVEVPIEEHQFEGEHYSILTEGFRVSLKSVDIDYPTITTTVTKTETKLKRWTGNVGLQAGWGYTVYGWSLYAGIGFGIGYNFDF